jgi:hypothetical protein
MAELNGLQDYPFAVIAHPISDNSDDELRAKARQAAEQCRELLTRRSGREQA